MNGIIYLVGLIVVIMAILSFLGLRLPRFALSGKKGDAPMTDTSRISEKTTGASYVEWSAIFAGAIVASAIIVLMTAFGSAIGLSLVSPYHGPSPIIFYIALTLWFT